MAKELFNTFGSELNDNYSVLPPSYNSQVDKAENCAKLDCAVPVHTQTDLISDNCLQKERTRQSIQTSDYQVSNYRHCSDDCNGINGVISNASQNRGLLVQDGYGVSGCTIDGDSNLRIGNVESRPKPCQQLFTRPYATVPYMGRGSGNSEVESFLRSSKQTHQQGTVSTLDNQVRTFNNNITPLVDNLEQQVQNPINLIPYDNDKTWVRGGAPTRQIVKDLDYYERSHDSAEIKDYVMGKKEYMRQCLNVKQ
jgi:hypothetical protein